MAPFSKLTLTSYQRTQPNRDPIEERRSKTLAALAQQKLVLEAALKGQEHTITKPDWARNADGNRQRVEKTHAVRPWFFQDTQGWVVQLKYGARIVPLDADNNAVIVQSLEDVSPVLEIFAKAASAGELDTALATLAQRRTTKIGCLGLRLSRMAWPYGGCLPRSPNLSLFDRGAICRPSSRLAR